MIRVRLPYFVVLTMVLDTFNSNTATFLRQWGNFLSKKTFHFNV